MSEKNHDFGSLVCIYAQALPRIRAKAKELGYAIALHGTMTRDLDLLAVPWIEDAADPQTLVEMIADELGGFVVGAASHRAEIEQSSVPTGPQQMPHGRLAWNICWGGRPFIDLSVMPRRT